MVAAYAAAAVAGGGSSGSLHSVMNTITVASSSTMEDRFVLKSHSFGHNFVILPLYITSSRYSKAN